jgi:hypothetical protein
MSYVLSEGGNQLTRIFSLCIGLPPIRITIAACTPVGSMSVNKTESLGIL